MLTAELCLCLQVTANKKELGVAFKKDAKAISDALDALPEDEADCLRKTLESGEGRGLNKGRFDLQTLFRKIASGRLVCCVLTACPLCRSQGCRIGLQSWGQPSGSCRLSHV